MKTDVFFVDAVKVDYDGNFDTYLKKYSKNIQLLFTKVQFLSAYVKKTSHGYHIYYNVKTRKELPFKTKLLLGLMLGDDTRRSVYSYIEGHNILFDKKKGKEAVYAEEETKKLNEVLNKGQDIKIVKVMLKL